MDDLDPDLGAGGWSGCAGDPVAVVDEPITDPDGFATFDPITSGIDSMPGLADRGDRFVVAGSMPSSVDVADPDPDLVELDDGDAAGPPVNVPGLDEIDLTDDDTGELAGEAAPAGVHGNPDAWTLNWFFQQVDGYCGPSAVAQVVAQYTGATITDPHQLVDRARELGLMGDPGEGMTLPNIEALLEDQGVPATITDSSLDDLRDRLDDGYAVIAMVDSGEIWHPDREAGEDDTADHVLVVAGIDDTRGVVILSDPGIPGGNHLEVPIDRFEDAWSDSGHRMLVTDAPDDGLIETPLPAQTRPRGRSAIITL